eukprot:1186609-Prorocentrum_minimum.AAC.3
MLNIISLNLLVAALFYPKPRKFRRNRHPRSNSTNQPFRERLEITGSTRNKKRTVNPSQLKSHWRHSDRGYVGTTVGPLPPRSG